MYDSEGYSEGYQCMTPRDTNLPEQEQKNIAKTYQPALF